MPRTRPLDGRAGGPDRGTRQGRRRERDPDLCPARHDPAVQPRRIHARVRGYLKSWGPDIGAHVTAGQVLASIDAPDLDQQFEQAKADLATAEANEQLAVLTAKRWRALVASQSVAQQVVDEKAGDAAAKKALVDAAQANVRRLEALEAFKSIVAPFDGVITARKTDIGALINAGSEVAQELFEVSDLHRVRIYVQVPQAFRPASPGLKATFRCRNIPAGISRRPWSPSSNASTRLAHRCWSNCRPTTRTSTLSAGTYCDVHFEIPGRSERPAPAGHGTGRTIRAPRSRSSAPTARRC